MLDINMDGPHPKAKKKPAAKKTPVAKKTSSSLAKKALSFIPSAKTIAAVTAVLGAAKVANDIARFYKRPLEINDPDKSTATQVIQPKSRPVAITNPDPIDDGDWQMNPVGFYQPQKSLPIFNDTRDYDYKMPKDYGSRRSSKTSSIISSISDLISLGSMASDTGDYSFKRKASEDNNERTSKRYAYKPYDPMIEKRNKQPPMYKDKKRQIM